MLIAVTGATGYVGKLVVSFALEHGHRVIAIDRERGEFAADEDCMAFVQADLTDYAQVTDALKTCVDGQSCEGVAHLAALRTPGDGRDATHNNNVTSSWNVLRAAAELGITRIAQASSINVIGLFWNKGPLQLDYLPLDENHPCRPDDPYSLSKQICEVQADALARRFPALRIASLRIHMVVPSRAHALCASPSTARRQLWGYTLDRSCARAFMCALTAPRMGEGHERFFIVEPDAAVPGDEVDTDTEVLLMREWGGVPVRGDVKGRIGLFDCSKARRMLGWVNG